LFSSAVHHLVLVKHCNEIRDFARSSFGLLHRPNPVKDCVSIGSIQCRE
jgi:hypothetical protein